MRQTLDEILLILFLLACLTIGGATLVEAGRWLLGYPRLGLGFWVSLLGGTILLLFLLVFLALTGALTVGVER